MTIASNSNVDMTFDATKEGYDLIGVCGWSIANASDSGTNGAYCVVIIARPDNTKSLFVRVRNTYSSQAKVLLRIWALYKKS